MALAQDDSAWRSPPPPELWYPNSANLQALPEADFFEVSATKLPIVLLSDLKSGDSVRLTTERAKYYVGRHYSLSDGKTPFLVRAVYENGGTGRFVVYRNGNDLIVYHGSLGKPHIKFKFALVVNLAFEPRRVYYFNSGAL